MHNWKELSHWRRKVRKKLLARRQSMSEQQQTVVREAVEQGLRRIFTTPEEHCIGFYWPFRGEIDLREMIGELIGAGARAALPVVVEKHKPLEFWAWEPETKLAPGIWNIPVPAERNPVKPTALLVPVLGFDTKRYRLGYGGGYYDRTLAIMRPVPLIIGVGFEMGRLDTIYPQLHDCPMDAVLTEYTEFDLELTPVKATELLDQSKAAATTREDDPPPYQDHLESEEVVKLLVKLLESERAGARGVLEMAGQTNGKSEKDLLVRIAKDESMFCDMLTKHITRLGGKPGTRTGPLYEKLVELDSFHDRLDLLNRGQGWIAHKLRETLPRIEDAELLKDLQMMLDVHERNISRSTTLQ